MNVISFRCKTTYLVEEEALRTDPGVSSVVLAVVEHLTVQAFVSVVAGVPTVALELALRQQHSQTVGLLLLLLKFFQLLFLEHVTSSAKEETS